MIRCSCGNELVSVEAICERCDVPRFRPMVTQDYQAGYKKGAEDCAGSLARLDEMERQRDAAWLECRRLRDALMGLRALVKAEFPSMECVDIDKADSALSGGTACR